MTVTEEGFKLMLKFACREHWRKIPSLRRKTDKNVLEDIINMSQCLSSLMKETSAP